MLKSFTQYFIRPLRQSYSQEELGPNSFRINSLNLVVHRQDFQLKNTHNLRIKGSFYRADVSWPCVLFLHSNNGSKLEGTYYLKTILQYGFQCCLVDFSGSGMSQGEYISLGYWQSEDVKYFVDWLRKNGVNKIYLWGKSMGAVAALIYLSKGGYANGCILDSPYSNLQTLAKEVAWQKLNMPGFLTAAMMYIIRREIRQKVNFQVEELTLLGRLSSIRIPAVFVASHNDSLVHHRHAEQLHEEYAGPKVILYIDQDHHEVRSESTLRSFMSQLRLHIENIQICQIKRAAFKAKKRRKLTIMQSEENQEFRKFASLKKLRAQFIVLGNKITSQTQLIKFPEQQREAIPLMTMNRCFISDICRE